MNEHWQQLLADVLDGRALGNDTLSMEAYESAEVKRLSRLARIFQQLQTNSESMHEAVLPREARLGAYRFLRVLGSGGMGDVWLAERADGTVEQHVAIKRVRSSIGQFSTRLESERRILARLSHPNIARFIDAGLDERELPWFAMEYVDGVHITHWCEQKQLTLRARLALFIKICSAVDHAHHHLVVHRDLKPSNILVDQQGEPKLLDFGIAKWLDAQSGDLTVNVLTPSYAAPEQLKREAISTASDVYSLGLLLFRLLVGEEPNTRKGRDLYGILALLPQEATLAPSAALAKRIELLALGQAQTSSIPIEVRELKGDLDAIVGKTLRFEPESRYQSASELALELQRVLNGEPVQARPSTRWYRFSRLVLRHRLEAALIGFASVGLAITTGTALWQAHQADAQRLLAESESSRAQAALLEVRATNQRNQEAKQFFIRTFDQIDPTRAALGEQLRAVDLIQSSLQRLEHELPNSPQARAELRYTFVTALRSLGRTPEDALSLMADSERELRGVKPTPLDSLVTVTQMQGMLQRDAGQFDAALERLQASNAWIAQMQGDHSALREQNLSAMGVLFTKRGDLEGSYQIAQQLLTLRSERLGSGHPDLAVAHNNIAAVALMLYRTGYAEQHFRQALALLLKNPQTPPLRTAQVRWYLAQALYHQQRYSEATREVKIALPVIQSTLGVNAREPAALRTFQWRLQDLVQFDPIDLPDYASEIAKLPSDDARRISVACYYHALALAKRKRYPEALLAFDQAIRAFSTVSDPNKEQRLATLKLLRASFDSTVETMQKIGALETALEDFDDGTHFQRQQHIELLMRLMELHDSAGQARSAEQAGQMVQALLLKQRE